MGLLQWFEISLPSPKADPQRRGRRSGNSRHRRRGKKQQRFTPDRRGLMRSGPDAAPALHRNGWMIVYRVHVHERAVGAAELAVAMARTLEQHIVAAAFAATPPEGIYVIGRVALGS